MSTVPTPGPNVGDTVYVQWPPGSDDESFVRLGNFVEVRVITSMPSAPFYHTFMQARIEHFGKGGLLFI